MKIMIIANDASGLYIFRKELIEKIVSLGHEVYVSVPDDEYINSLEQVGSIIIKNYNMQRRGTNPLKDYQLLNHYKTILREIRPNIVFTYTIKPNVYGGLACKQLNIPYIANVTGLGTSIQNRSLIQIISILMYKLGLRGAKKVFFQNTSNRDYMLSHRIIKESIADLLPGSGVNTKQHRYESYPKDDSIIVLTTVGRIMKDKGIDEILCSAEEIKRKYQNVEFRLIGDFDEGYQDIIADYSKRGIIKYLGVQKDIHPYMADSHAILHASYHEGMSNVLLEALSTGRPVIATDIPGCIETFEPNVTGLSFKPKNIQSMVKAIDRFVNLPHETKEEMGKRGREKVVREFSRDIVIDKYMNELSKIQKGASN